MGLSGARKLLLVLMITACVFSGTAEAWSWSWGSGQSGLNWGWGSDNSGSGSSGSGSGGSDSNSGGGSSWGFGWSSNGTDTNWGWGSSSGSNHSSGTGSTHNNHTALSNHSSGTGSTHNNHTAPSNHSSRNHTGPSNHSGGTGSTSNNSHIAAPISHRRKIEVTVWKNGFDYQEWASKHAPFYVNDVLVVKYNNNNDDQTQSKTKHSNKNDVYLLPDSRSYKRCDVTRGKKLVARGSSSSLGFKLLLRKTQTYYLASGDHNGCNHKMKFSFSPVPRPSSQTKP